MPEVGGVGSEEDGVPGSFDVEDAAPGATFDEDLVLFDEDFHGSVEFEVDAQVFRCFVIEVEGFGDAGEVDGVENGDGVEDDVGRCFLLQGEHCW